MLNLEQLKNRCADGEVFEYLFFWRPESEAGVITESCLSQWFESSFTIEGQEYVTAEHWMMASKARLFGDHDALSKILETPDPRRVREIGRGVRKFRQAVWEHNARRIVTEGNIAKFGQDEDLKSFLLGTGDALLVEASPYDRIWGIGLRAEDPRANSPATWDGQNLLGFALMDVRVHFRS